jgi:hypothetical protein
LDQTLPRARFNVDLAKAGRAERASAALTPVALGDKSVEGGALTA